MPNITGATSYFTRSFENTTAMTLGGSVTGGSSTTIPITNLNTNYNNGDWVALVVDANVPTAKQVVYGQVSTGTLVNAIWTEGTNQAHSAGATVVDYVTGTHWDLLQKGLLVAHNQNGTLANGVVNNSVIASGSVSLDKITNPYACSVYRAGTWTAGNNVTSKIVFDTVIYDYNSNYSTSTGLYTAPVAGLYAVSALISMDSISGAGSSIFVSKNAGAKQWIGNSVVPYGYTGTFNLSLGFHHEGLLLSAGDTLEVDSYAGGNTGVPGEGSTYFSIRRVA